MEEIILGCLEEITGIEVSEFKANTEVHLLNEGIVDSLCLISLFELLSGKLNAKLTVSDFVKDDFDGVMTFVHKVEALCRK